MSADEIMSAILMAATILAIAAVVIVESSYEQGREDGGVHILDVLEQEGYCDKGIKQ